MRRFPQTNFFSCQLSIDARRIDLEYTDPRYKLLQKKLEDVKRRGYVAVPVGELCDTLSGKTPSEYLPTDSQIEKVRIIKLRNVTGRGIDWGTEFISQSFYEQNKDCHLSLNDVLVTSTGEGTIGRADILDRHIPCMTDGHVTALRVRNQNQLSPAFLLHYLRSEFGQVQMERWTVGSTGQTELNDPDIKAMMIAYPESFGEQSRIVKQIKDQEDEARQSETKADEELRKTEAIIVEELKIKPPFRKGVDRYLIHLSKDSPRFDFEYNNPFYEEYGNFIRESKITWMPLYDLTSLSSETTNPLTKPEEVFQYVEIGSIDTRWGKPISIPMLGKEAKSSRMRQVMHEGQILVSTTRPTRRAIALVPEELDGQVCSTGFAVLQCGDKINNEYLFHVLRTRLITHQFRRLSTGSGYPEISKSEDLLKILVPVPFSKSTQESVQAQEKIADRLRKVVERAHDLFDAAIEKWNNSIRVLESDMDNGKATES
jgi:restriction endonuclease S subunit